MYSLVYFFTFLFQTSSNWEKVLNYNQTNMWRCGDWVGEIHAESSELFALVKWSFHAIFIKNGLHIYVFISKEGKNMTNKKIDMNIFVGKLSKNFLFMSWVWTVSIEHFNIQHWMFYNVHKSYNMLSRIFLIPELGKVVETRFS